MNDLVTVFVFIGPAFFIFMLMYLGLRFFKKRCSYCRGANDDTQGYWHKAVTACLISPVIWIIILLLDGEYIACGMTYWNGVYVFDDVLQNFWCKPTEETESKTLTELRNLTSKYIHQSQVSGYALTGIFSVLLFVSVVVYDCCNSGRCHRCPSQLLCCRRRAATQHEGQHVETVTGRIDAPCDTPSNTDHSTTQNQTPSEASPRLCEVTGAINESIRDVRQQSEVCGSNAEQQPITS
ncbi:uncharacterized protein LOC113040693 [Carassius auratus]|uniref:Uncharacterized protein LOC113040693 n=1 Tax=Carassius auratus TaxID=7957 RepID=A0A6P6J3N5_CARAU|nr:uncharacterized protein LOC113040693 [Carassius auratus]